MARWSTYRRRRYGSYSRRGRKWSPTTQVASRVTSGTGQSSQPIALNQLQASGGVTNPVGPIMKVKNFRLNIVFASSVTVLWALVYVPEGLPIGTLNTGSVVTTPASSFARTSAVPNHERYLLSAAEFGNECRATQSLSPLARNLNPGDGIFFIWRARERLRSRNRLHFQLLVL